MCFKDIGTVLVNKGIYDNYSCILSGHFAGEDVKAKLAELHGRWDTLKSKASQRRQDLEDSLQAQQYFADANEAESWMREKEPIVGSTDYGKDEDSAEVHADFFFQKITTPSDILTINK